MFFFIFQLTEKERIIAEQRKQQVEDFKRQKAERKRIADKVSFFQTVYILHSIGVTYNLTYI